MTVIPNFAEIHLEPQNQPAGGDGLDDWTARFKTETGKSPGDFLWETPELIKVKPLYSPPIWKGLIISTPCRAFPLICVARTRRCT